MKKLNNLGFTLIEMMIVLMIISTLLIITIPNVTDNSTVVRERGCEAYVKLVEAQVQAFQIKEGILPGTIDDLVNGGYIETTTCPNGDVISYDSTTGQISR